MLKKRDIQMCAHGRAGEPTKPVQFRKPYTQTEYKEAHVHLCERCRKSKANRGLFRLVKGE